jgi:hypothetical protein
VAPDLLGSTVTDTEPGKGRPAPTSRGCPPIAGPFVGADGSRPFVGVPEPAPQLSPPTLQIAVRAVSTIEAPMLWVEAITPATIATMHAITASHSTFVCPADPCRRLTHGGSQWPRPPTMGREAHLARGPA